MTFLISFFQGMLFFMIGSLIGTIVGSWYYKFMRRDREKAIILIGIMLIFYVSTYVTAVIISKYSN